MNSSIKEIIYGAESTISGFVENIRDSKNMVFLIIKDSTDKIQITMDKRTIPTLAQVALTLTPQSYVSITGVAMQSEYVKMGGREMTPTDIVIHSISDTIPLNPDSNIDTRLDNRHIDLRAPEHAIIFRVQTTLAHAMRGYCIDHGCVEIHSPKIIPTPSEGGAEMFELKYFDRKAYLAQSPQFYKQMGIASGFGRVFEVGPVFRAEQSHTARHATEFTGFDVEIGDVDSHEDVMRYEEEMLAYAISVVRDKHAAEIKELLGIDIVVPTLPFPRITMDEAYTTLRGIGHDISDGDDFGIESERALCEYYRAQTGHQFLFVKDYPTTIRAFYHMIDTSTNRTKRYDLYFNNTEITTGAQREHRYDMIKKQALEKGLSLESIQFYLDFFRYGCPPHGGFGIGLDRLIMLLLGIPSIKEAEYIFRGPGRMFP